MGNICSGIALRFSCSPWKSPMLGFTSPKFVSHRLGYFGSTMHPLLKEKLQTQQIPEYLFSPLTTEVARIWIHTHGQMKPTLDNFLLPSALFRQGSCPPALGVYEVVHVWLAYTRHSTAPFASRVQHGEMDLGQWLLGYVMWLCRLHRVAVASLCKPTPAKPWKEGFLPGEKPGSACTAFS